MTNERIEYAGIVCALLGYALFCKGLWALDAWLGIVAAGLGLMTAGLFLIVVANRASE